MGADFATPGPVLAYAAALGVWWQWLDWARRGAPSGSTGFEDAEGNRVPLAALENLLPAFLGYEGRVSVDRWHRPYWGPVLRTMDRVLRSFGGGRWSPTIIPPPTPPPT